MVFAKMLLLETATDAGRPLLGALVGFRKLTVGNRKWRIVWRETTDEQHRPVLDIAEVWTAGDRTDSEVYAEMTSRVERLGRAGSPHAKPLAAVVARLGHLYDSISPLPEPEHNPVLPDWLRAGLAQELRLSDEQIESMTEDEARQAMIEHWSRR